MQIARLSDELTRLRAEFERASGRAAKVTSGAADGLGGGRGVATMLQTTPWDGVANGGLPGTLPDDPGLPTQRTLGAPSHGRASRASTGAVSSRLTSSTSTAAPPTDDVSANAGSARWPARLLELDGSVEA